MKATLKFNLPEESSDHQLCLDAHKWYLAAWELDQWIQNILKHGESNGVTLDSLNTPAMALEKAREILRLEMLERNITFDDGF